MRRKENSFDPEAERRIEGCEIPNLDSLCDEIEIEQGDGEEVFIHVLRAE